MDDEKGVKVTPPVHAGGAGGGPSYYSNQDYLGTGAAPGFSGTDTLPSREKDDYISSSEKVTRSDFFSRFFQSLFSMFGYILSGPSACNPFEKEPTPSGESPKLVSRGDNETSPVSNRMLPNECFDKGIIKKKREIVIPGLDRPIPVWYAADLAINDEKLDQNLKEIFLYFGKIIPLEALKLFLSGQKQNSNTPTLPGKIILTPDNSQSFVDVVYKCGKQRCASDKSIAGVQVKDGLYLKVDERTMKDINFSDRFTVEDFALTHTLIHELFHALQNLLNSDFKALKDHYEGLIHMTFPQKRKYERFHFLSDRLHYGKATEVDEREFDLIYSPNLKRYFIISSAGKNFSEYFAYSASAYLNQSSRFWWANRKRLKLVDPVAFEMWEAFFERGGLDVTPLEVGFNKSLGKIIQSPDDQGGH